MPQPETSTRTSVLIGTAAALLLVSASLALFGSGRSLGVIAAVVALAALIPLALLFVSLKATGDEANAQRFAVETQRRENERNQQAILRLLDEIAGLGQ